MQAWTVAVIRASGYGPAIEDSTGGRTPFKVEAGARTNSLYVDNTGRVGVGTANPVATVHAVTGNTPTLRLDQDGSSGFTPQVWDVAGNEANFFVRDVTHGSTLPLRIRPGAPSSSIDVAASGKVGIGTASPATQLHVNNSSNSGTSADNTGLTVKSANRTAYVAIDSPVGGFPSVVFFNGGTESGRILYSNSGNYLTMSTSIVERLRIDSAGNVGIGTVNPTHKLHVVGNSLVEGTLQVTGGVLPDYVFAPEFKLASIEENAAYMWKHRHLPAVGPAQTTADGRGLMNVFSLNSGMLEELEKAHIYIEKLHLEIKKLQSEAVARDTEIRAELAELRRHIAR